MKVGTKLLLSNGCCAKIETIQVEQLEIPETTYNFEVEDFHTYYVGESEEVKLFIKKFLDYDADANEADILVSDGHCDVLCYAQPFANER